MFKQITNLDGNEWYLIISLLIFMAFFIIVTIGMLTMKKDYNDYMRHMPLDDSNNSEIENQEL